MTSKRVKDPVELLRSAENNLCRTLRRQAGYTKQYVSDTAGNPRKETPVVAALAQRLADGYAKKLQARVEPFESVLRDPKQRAETTFNLFETFMTGADRALIRDDEQFAHWRDAVESFDALMRELEQGEH